MNSSKKQAFVLLSLSILCMHLFISIAPIIPIQDFKDSLPVENIQISPVHTNTISDILGESITVVHEDGAFEGYNMFSVTRQNLLTSDTDEFFFVIDMDGNIVRQESLPAISRTEEFIDSTTILRGDTVGSLFWNYYTDETEELGIEGHHDWEYNRADDTIFSLSNYIDTINGSLYRFDEINEFERDGSLIWSIDTQSFVSVSEWCPYKDSKGDVGDVTHANSVFYDEVDDMLYVNMRNTNTFYKIDHDTKEIVWGLGEHGDFSQYDIDGNPVHSLFYHAHAVEKIGDNRYILFDNDVHNQENITSQNSRIIEIVVNEDTMTANITWQWIAPLSYYSSYWGDADRLPNGNRLGTFGVRDHPEGNYSARLVEVNNEGEIVWELSFPLTEQYAYGIYRMERIRFTPILDSPSDFLVVYEHPTNITWQAWYNTRQKKLMYGDYNLYANNTLIDTGTVVYDQFWLPTNLSFDVSALEIGQYNLTLMITDEAGHQVSDSINLTIASFKIERTGPTEYESGDIESEIRWTGQTIDTLLYNITLNGSLHAESLWNGEDIILDQSSLEVGVYNVNLELFNGSESVYVDDFWIEVYSSESPQFLSMPTDSVIQWNETVILEWEIFDNRPNYWYLFVDDVLTDSGRWMTRYQEINWTVAPNQFGMHNITLQIFDNGLRSNHSTVIIEVLSPSAPLIIPLTSETFVVWGSNDFSFRWEVYGGTDWTLWRNQTQFDSGIFESSKLEIPIVDWHEEQWDIGIYNMTLVVSNDDSFSTNTIWIMIGLDIGDPYADAVIPSLSLFSNNEENALGAPDEQYASIFTDYSDGFLTLDMGENEEIVDGVGVDFRVIAIGGVYRIWISETLDSALIDVGLGNGTTEFDLSASSIAQVRYVRVQYSDGLTIQLDAIEAINCNSQNVDTSPPEIIPLDDIEMLENQTTVILTWIVSDDTPYIYEILIDGEIANSDFWNGSDITYEFTPSDSGMYEITLRVSDLFGNNASDQVQVTKLASQPETQVDFLVPLILGISISAIVIVVILIWNFKLRSKGSS